MLLLLFQQLVAPFKPTTADMDSMRKEIWCIMNASVGSPLSLVGSSAVASAGQSPPGQGVQKLDCPLWRKGMENVLLQIGSRVRSIKTRLSSAPPTNATPSSSDATTFLPPDEATLRLITSYFATNVKSDSRLFLLLQSRLQDTIGAVLAEEFTKEAKKPAGTPGWWIPNPTPVSVPTGRTPLSGCTSRVNTLMVPSRLMADSSENRAPGSGRRGTKRSHGPGDLGEDESDYSSCSSDGEQSVNGGDKRKRRLSGKIALRTVPSLEPARITNSTSSGISLVDAALVKNGLNPLAGEVRALGEKLAMLGTFHLKVYSSWYSTILP